MRKIFVVLLVLAIAGGALAQEAEEAAKEAKENGWGTWSGSVELSTDINFSKFGKVEDGVKTTAGVDSVDEKNETAGDSLISGNESSIELKLQWDYAKDNWTVTVPFVINKDDGVKIDGASVGYEDGPLTVSIPFGVNLGNFVRGKTETGKTDTDADAVKENADFGSPINSSTTSTYEFRDIFKDINIEATYETDTYAFGAGMNNIFKDIAGPSDFKAWGWYDLFDGAAKLAVSYGGGYATEWWRASTIVLQGSTTFWNDEGIDTNLRWARTDTANKYGKGYNGSSGTGYSSSVFSGASGYFNFSNDGQYFDLNDDGYYHKDTGYGYHWGNIADGGIGFKIDVIPGLNVGFTFGGGTDMFKAKSGDYDLAPNPDYNDGGVASNFVDSFLRQFVFGAGFENDMFAVSAMLGFSPHTNSKFYEDYVGHRSTDLYIHAGVKVNIMEGISVAADISMKSYSDRVFYVKFKEQDGDYNGGEGKPFVIDPNSDTKYGGLYWNDGALGFNIGAEVDVKLDFGLSANLKFAAIDLGDNTNYSYDPGRALGATGTDKGRFDASEINNLGMMLGLGFQLGYDMDLSETLALGISAGLVMKDGKNTQTKYSYVKEENGTKTVKTDYKNLDYFYLGINPVLTWAVIENGTIKVGYNFGFETQKKELTNELSLAFAWSF